MCRSDVRVLISAAAPIDDRRAGPRGSRRAAVSEAPGHQAPDRASTPELVADCPPGGQRRPRRGDPGPTSDGCDPSPPTGGAPSTNSRTGTPARDHEDGQHPGAVVSPLPAAGRAQAEDQSSLWPYPASGSSVLPAHAASGCPSPEVADLLSSVAGEHGVQNARLRARACPYLLREPLPDRLALRRGPAVPAGVCRVDSVLDPLPDYSVAT